MPLDDTLALAEAATTPVATPAVEPAVTIPAEIDPDDAEVTAARAEAEKPDAPVATTPPATTTPATTPAAATTTPAAEDPEQVMIPKWRFDQQVAKEREAAARLQGENEALKLMIAPKSGAPATTTVPAKTADEQLKDIRDARKVIAKKFDDGEISRLQEAEELEALEDRQYAIREEQWKAKHAPQQPQGNGADTADDMRLDELTVQLAEDHPFVDHLNDEQRDFLVVEATRQLQKEGVKFGTGNLPAPQRFILRERVAKLSDAYGPVMTGKTLAQIKPAPGTTTPAKPGLSPIAQARDAKLDLARNAPPSLNQISGTPGSTEATDDQIAMMDEDAIAALPKATRNRIMGLPA